MTNEQFRQLMLELRIIQRLLAEHTSWSFDRAPRSDGILQDARRQEARRARRKKS